MSNLDTFLEHFRKGEQIFVGFRDGYTHGYISKADETGLYLVQLNHAKEYRYDWNQFEVIAHAGVHLTKLKPASVATLIEVRFKEDHSCLSSEVKKSGLNLALWSSDSKSVEIPMEFRLREESWFQGVEEAFWPGTDAISIKDHISISPKKYELVGDIEVTGPKYVVQLNAFPDADHWSGGALLKIPTAVTSKLNTRGVFVVRTDFIFDIVVPKRKADHYWETVHGNMKTILKIIDGSYEQQQRKIQPVRSCDPWEFDGIPIGTKVWENQQGIVMINIHGSLYFDPGELEVSL